MRVRADWWRNFNSHELDRLVAATLAQNMSLQAAIARVREAEGTAQVVAAPLYPSVGVSANASGSGFSNQSSSNRVSLLASYELDFWGKNRAAARSATLLATASRSDADIVAMTLSATVAADYMTVLALRERIAVANRAAAAARDQLALIQVRRRLGTATDLELRQQEVAIAGFDSVGPTLNQQLAATLHALAVLTGQAPGKLAVPPGSLDTIARPAIAADLPPQLLTLRPDIQAAEARLQAANFDVGVARAAFLPSVSLSAGPGLALRSFPPAAVATVGASLLAPLFAGGQLRGQLTIARGRQEELVATYRQTILTALQDVEDSLSAINNTTSQEAIQARAFTAAQKAADLARLQYRFGSADYLTVLTTQQTAYSAEDALLQLRLQHLLGLVSLCRALGGGFNRGDLARSATGTAATFMGGDAR